MSFLGDIAMSVEDEVSLGDAAPVGEGRGDDFADELSLSESELDAVNAKRALDQASKDFDLQAWIEGARSAKTSVRIYARMDLDQEIQAVAAEAYEAHALGSKSRLVELGQESRRLKAAYFASALDVVLEERSKEWQARKMRELREQGIKSEKDLTLGIIAAQTVAPEGFDFETLKAFAELSPVQANRIVQAWGQLSGKEDKSLPHF